MDIKEAITTPSREGASYDVVIGSGTVSKLGQMIRSGLNPQRTTVISNTDVWEFAGDRIASSMEDAGVPFDLIAIPEGESNKNLETVAVVYDAMVHAKACRMEPVIAVGGGVIGDLAGFVAATFMRGVPFINVPTTLLAMIDSSIGGKTGVDLPAGKNLVGAFHQPRFVLSDIDFLKTLTERELKCGIAEAIKTAFLAGGDFMSFIEDKIDAILQKDTGILAETVKRSVRFKGDVVAEDPMDICGQRAILNYGHTFGHALETIGDYQDLNHGEAVALGMVFAARLSQDLGFCGPDLVTQTERLLGKAGLRTRVRIDNAEGLIEIMGRDKKNTGGSARFVLLEDVGRPVLCEVAWSDVLALMKEMENA